MIEQNSYMTGREEDYILRGAQLKVSKSDYSSSSPSYTAGRQLYSRMSSFAMQGFHGDYNSH